MPSPLGLVRRTAWILLGLIAVAVGGIGIVVPGLPTTVFFIAAAACFTRSSPRLERWVLDLPSIGPAVQRYRDGLGMPRRAKYWACGMIVVFSSASVLLLDARWLRVGIAIAAAIGLWYVVVRVPTTPAAALEPDPAARHRTGPTGPSRKPHTDHAAEPD